MLFLEFCCNLVGVIHILLRDWKYTNLLRAKPCREFSGIMLDEPSQCTLVASHGCTVDDPRQNLLTLLINVVHTELFCTCAVKLDGYHRIFLAVYVLCLNINLRSVECGLSVSLCERNMILIHNVTQILLGAVPVLVIAKIFLLVIRIPLRQTVSNISVDTKSLHYIVTQLGTSCQFFLSLIRTKNDMCLCDCRGQPLP